MKINDLWVDLTDVSAIKEALLLANLTIDGVPPCHVFGVPSSDFVSNLHEDIFAIL